MNENGCENSANDLGPLFDRSRWTQALCEKIEELEKSMESERFRTRTEVLEGVVKPLFVQLGWKFADPRTVVPGFETGPGKVDLALCHPPGHPRILVQIGAPPDSGRGQGGHLFDDRALDALQLAISGNGREWAFHFPAGVGSMRNREFARFDIVRDPEEEVAGELERYLAFHAVESGEAFGRAERCYRDRRFPADAVAAWRRALLGSEVLERFQAEMKAATGVPAGGDRAREFVRRRVAGMEWPADPPDPKPARRAMLGDRVWIYDFVAREIVERVVVDGDPDWENGEVSRDSAVGAALLGAREGEVREASLPDGVRPIRIVLVRSPAHAPAAR